MPGRQYLGLHTLIEHKDQHKLATLSKMSPYQQSQMAPSKGFCLKATRESLDDLLEVFPRILGLMGISAAMLFFLSVSVGFYAMWLVMRGWDYGEKGLGCGNVTLLLACGLLFSICFLLVL